LRELCDFGRVEISAKASSISGYDPMANRPTRWKYDRPIPYTGSDDNPHLNYYGYDHDIWRTRKTTIDESCGGLALRCDPDKRAAQDRGRSEREGLKAIMRKDRNLNSKLSGDAILTLMSANLTHLSCDEGTPRHTSL
jgi:hypothetical protein